MRVVISVSTKSKIILLCVGIFLLVDQSFGQTNDAKKFESVPVLIREGLIKRLDLFLAYDLTNQYDKKYDLFSEYTRTVTSIKTKDEFVKFQQNRAANGKGWTLISFNISSVEDESLDDSPDFRIFHINGLVKYYQGKKIKKENLFLEARYENGDWYFSNWGEKIWSK